jgi:hypothetical protein
VTHSKCVSVKADGGSNPPLSVFKYEIPLVSLLDYGESSTSVDYEHYAKS